MPELPEVEICRRLLSRWTEGRALSEVRLIDAAVVRTGLSTRPSDADPDAAERLSRLRGPFGAVLRHGKRAGIEVAGQPILLHLGMTGQWRRTEEEPPYARLGWRLDDGAWLWFVDRRRFGCVYLADDFDGLSAGLGPDALDAPPSGEELCASLRGRRAVKVALMDQAILAGLGNIHAVEVLFKTGIPPALPCGRLTPADCAALSETIPKHLAWVLEAEGDDELVYVTDGGENFFSVYGREGEPCAVCGTTLRKVTLSGRSTFWCPGCQPDR